MISLDRALAGLVAAVVVQSFLRWRVPTEVWREDLSAELKLIDTLMGMKVDLAEIREDTLLVAALRNLKDRRDLVRSEISRYDDMPWYQQRLIDTSSYHGHVQWMKEWRQEWGEKWRAAASVFDTEPDETELAEDADSDRSTDVESRAGGDGRSTGSSKADSADYVYAKSEVTFPEDKALLSNHSKGLQTPEEVVQFLRAATGPDAGNPPPEVVGVALKRTQIPATEENVARALREAFGREASAEDVATAIAAAEAEGDSREPRQPRPQAAQLPLSGDEGGDPTKAVLRQVLALMDKEPNNPLMQEQGCESLRYLAVDEGSQRTIAANSGIEAVLRAMRENPHAAEVQGYCCGTLTHLANPADSRADIIRLKGLHAVLRAIKRHPNSALVQYKGCAALANLAKGADAQRQVVALGGHKKVLKTFFVHLHDATVLGHCAGALYNVLANPDNLGSIDASKVAKAVRQGMKMHPNAADLQRAGSLVLAKLEDVSDGPKTFA
eukprot:TRINITY_DN109222_c0_g1_i1.p1 TRINITY_DN109222_c0_g1~~TRINITY_DN109222_c0_g1_i1.p1  ORF type:complete len:498 (+),score=112.68 TRINITY_DN109222_c0_g1_i1:27-1520(+)